MALNELIDLLHRIRVKLFPNYLPKVEGKYLAKTVNEEMLTVEQVCASLKKRGGFTGSYPDLVEHVNLYHDESLYLLCDGYGVKNKLCSMKVNVGGTFESVREGVTLEKHPLDVRYRMTAEVCDALTNVEVEVVGLADSGAFIDDFFDKKSGLYNQRVTPGGLFSMSGSKIEIAGTSPKVGLYLVAPGSPAIAVKVMEIVVNKPHEIVGSIPDLPAGKTWTLEVRTQYSNSSTMLKEVRVIASSFTLTEA